MVVTIRSLPPSGVETSLSLAIASPPRVRMRSATRSASLESFPNPDTSVPRSFTTTRAPRSARSSTYARPSPRPAPVTTATFPSNEIRSVIALSSCSQGGVARLRLARARRRLALRRRLGQRGVRVGQLDVQGEREVVAGHHAPVERPVPGDPEVAPVDRELRGEARAEAPRVADDAVERERDLDLALDP